MLVGNKYWAYVARNLLCWLFLCLIYVYFMRRTQKNKIDHCHQLCLSLPLYHHRLFKLTMAASTHYLPCFCMNATLKDFFPQHIGSTWSLWWRISWNTTEALILNPTFAALSTLYQTASDKLVNCTAYCLLLLLLLLVQTLLISNPHVWMWLLMANIVQDKLSPAPLLC